MTNTTPQDEPTGYPSAPQGAPGYPVAPPAAYPAAPYPTAPGYGAYAPAARTNTLAIVSLISAIVGVLVIPFIGSLVAVITGHMSLGQIKRTQEQGRGLALAGTIVGWVGLGLCVLGVIVLLAFLPLFFAAVANSGSMA